MENQQTKHDTYLIVCQFFLFAAMISGYKGIAYMVAAAFGFLLLLKLRSMNKGHIAVNKPWKFFIGFIVFYTVTSLINFDLSNYVVYTIVYFLMFLPLLISHNLLCSASETTIINSLKCCLAVFMGFCVIAIYHYLQNPGLARDMASHQVEESLAIGGGYSLAYAATIIGVYIFSKMVNKCIKINALSVIIVLICTALVYLTESSITMFAMFTGFLVSILFANNEVKKFTLKDASRYFIVFFIIAIIAVYVISNKYELAEWILNFAEGKENNVVYSRIVEAINELVYGESTYHVNVRYATLENSIDLFLENPIIGAGYKYGYNFEAGKYEYAVGNHSEILDAFAKYGILGAILWLQPYFSVIKKMLKKSFGCVVAIIIMMFFNPFATFHTNTVLLFFIPITEELISRRKIK